MFGNKPSLLLKSNTSYFLSKTLTLPSQSASTPSNLSSLPASDEKTKFLITGNHSTLYLSANASPFKDDAEYVCTTFQIIPMDKLKNVHIISQGLGKVSFQSIPAQGDISCSEENTNGKKNYLKILALDSPERIFAQFGPVSLPEPGNKLSGTIKVYADGASLAEIPLQVEQPSYKQPWGPLIGFLGILVPALVGIGAYSGRKRLDILLAERKEMSDFRRDYASNLNKFFELYPIIWHRNLRDESNFAQEIKSILNDESILDSLPSRVSERLRQVLEGKSREKIQVELIRLFPDYKTEIKSPKEK